MGAAPQRRRPTRPSLRQRPAKGDAEPAAAAFAGEADDVAAVVWATCRARPRPRPSMLPMPPISRETLTATGLPPPWRRAFSTRFRILTSWDHLISSRPRTSHSGARPGRPKASGESKWRV